MIPRAVTLFPLSLAVVLAAGCGGSRVHRERIDQWASAAFATSNDGAGPYSADRATGPNDVTGCVDSPNAWSPANAQPGTPGDDDVLDVTFDRYVFVSDIGIYETFNPGAITHVVLQATDGSAPDAIIDNPTGPGPCPSILHFQIAGGPTADQYDHLQIYIDSDLIGDADGSGSAANDFNEIDAVKLTGDELLD